MDETERKKIWETAQRRQQESFLTKLNTLIDERGVSDAEVYRAAQIDRKTFCNFHRKKNYHPSKRFTFALAVVLKLSVEETKDLIGRLGDTFNPTDEFDLVIEECLNRKLYDLDEINCILDERGLPLLGSSKL